MDGGSFKRIYQKYMNKLYLKSNPYFNNFTRKSALIFLLLLSIVGCDSSGAKSKQQNNQYFNVIVLLDLSDRDLSNNYNAANIRLPPDIPVEHDIRIIKNVFSAIKNAVSSKIDLNAKDRIRIVPAPQVNNNYGDFFRENYSYFDIDMEKIRVELRRDGQPISLPRQRDEFDRYVSNLLEKLRDLYNIATRNPTPTGADFFGFFNDSLEQYLQDDHFKNILIILTNGGINELDNNITRDLPPNERSISQDLKRQLDRRGPLKILVLGIHPIRPIGDEYTIIKQQWINRIFNNIGLNENDYDFSKEEESYTVEDKLKKFINQY